MARIFLVSLLIIVALSGLNSRLLVKRLVQEEHTTSGKSKPVELCLGNFPCGWLLYDKFTRAERDFLKNACVCPKGFQCVQEEDNLGLSAYTHRCRKPDNKT